MFILSGQKHLTSFGLYSISCIPNSTKPGQHWVRASWLPSWLPMLTCSLSKQTSPKGAGRPKRALWTCSSLSRTFCSNWEMCFLCLQKPVDKVLTLTHLQYEPPLSLADTIHTMKVKALDSRQYCFAAGGRANEKADWGEMREDQLQRTRYPPVGTPQSPCRDT